MLVVLLLFSALVAAAKPQPFPSFFLVLFFSPNFERLPLRGFVFSPVENFRPLSLHPSPPTHFQAATTSGWARAFSQTLASVDGRGHPCRFHLSRDTFRSPLFPPAVFSPFFFNLMGGTCTSILSFFFTRTPTLCPASWSFGHKTSRFMFPFFLEFPSVRSASVPHRGRFPNFFLMFIVLEETPRFFFCPFWQSQVPPGAHTTPPPRRSNTSSAFFPFSPFSMEFLSGLL